MKEGRSDQNSLSQIFRKRVLRVGVVKFTSIYRQKNSTQWWETLVNPTVRLRALQSRDDRTVQDCFIFFSFFFLNSDLIVSFCLAIYGNEKWYLLKQSKGLLPKNKKIKTTKGVTKKD